MQVQRVTELVIHHGRVIRGRECRVLDEWRSECVVALLASATMPRECLSAMAVTNSHLRAGGRLVDYSRLRNTDLNNGEQKQRQLLTSLCDLCGLMRNEGAVVACPGMTNRNDEAMRQSSATEVIVFKVLQTGIPIIGTNGYPAGVFYETCARYPIISFNIQTYSHFAHLTCRPRTSQHCCLFAFRSV